MTAKRKSCCEESRFFPTSSNLKLNTNFGEAMLQNIHYKINKSQQDAHALVCLARCVDLIDESKQKARLRPRRSLSYSAHASSVQTGG